MEFSKTGREKSIDPLLFDWPAAAPALKASVCSDCGAMAFPQNNTCMSCGSDRVAIVLLPAEGTLWTYTTQGFMPKAPYDSDETAETFQPFAVGYIELPGALRIESRIPLREGKPLAIGMAMQLNFYTHRVDADGTAVISYQFVPA